MGTKFPWRLMNGCNWRAVWIQENAERGMRNAEWGKAYKCDESAAPPAMPQHRAAERSIASHRNSNILATGIHVARVRGEEINKNAPGCCFSFPGQALELVPRIGQGNGRRGCGCRTQASGRRNLGGGHRRHLQQHEPAGSGYRASR